MPNFSSGKTRSYKTRRYKREFAQSVVNMWQPDEAFVLDIADTPNGLKVIEINNLNTSGLYDADVFKIIDALETMILKHHVETKNIM